MPSVGALASAERPAAALPWAALAAALAGVVAVFWPTFESLVSVWRQSDTFAHCFLIPPICVFLIWRRRAALERAPLELSWLGLAAVLGASLAWAVARAANVQVGEQLAAVLLVPATVVAVLGRKAAREIAFPLGYLLFAVPFGEVLIPALMDWTATFTVAALRVTGIPVFRDGFYFSIPTGDFEVAKACSGIRYLIACLSLGVLYANLAYRSWRKRALFVAVSVVAPIVANGVRAYLIVMIAHLSSMRFAVGADHLVYGWLFFGGLVALLFWIGNKFEDPPEHAERAAAAAAPVRRAPVPIVAAAVAAVVLAAAGPYLVETRGVDGAGTLRAARVPAVDGWDGPRAAGEPWHAASPGRREIRASYARSNAPVELGIWRYERQSAGEELVGALGAALEPRRAQIVDDRRADTAAGGFATREVVLREGAGERVIWYWYSIGGTRTASDAYAKLLEAWNTLSRGGAESALIVLTASGSDADADAARPALADFVRAAGSRIDSCLRSNAGCVEAP